MIDNTALQPCPFCGGEAQTIYALYDQNQWHVYCKKCGVNAPGYGLESDVIAAWNRRTEPAKEPLTLDELRGMNGEPVWCVDAKGRGIWALVHTRDEVCTDADFGDWEFYCYGWMDSEVGWLAYKGKQEGARDEMQI